LVERRAFFPGAFFMESRTREGKIRALRETAVHIFAVVDMKDES
jgi:hypothetical protein